MILRNQHPEDPPVTGLYEFYHQINDDTYFVNSPCVFTENKLLKSKAVYELHDFFNKSIKLRYVKPLWIYLKGFTFNLIFADIQSGMLLRRTRRLNADELPCSFAISEPLYFFPEIEERVLNAYNNGDKAL